MTDIGICNLALGYLAVDPLTSFADGTEQAALCSAFYSPVKEALLEERAWTFAKTQYQATPDVTGPLFGWTSRYAVPANCVRVQRVDDGSGAFDVEWERVGAFIYADTDAATIDVWGIAGNAAEAGFSPLFNFALALRLAVELCIPLTENATLHKTLALLAEAKVREAAGADGSQGKSEAVRSAGSLKTRR